jgi:hypothetical protein
MSAEESMKRRAFFGTTLAGMSITGASATPPKVKAEKVME